MISNLFPTYNHRLATPDDASAIAPLWEKFAQERAAVDPTMVVKPNFDFLSYVHQQLTEPLSYCWVLERHPPQLLIGCLFIYFYEETLLEMSPDVQIHNELESPFIPRRIATTLGLYILPEYRKPKLIRQLIQAGIQQAESMKVTDIDLLIAMDQTGIQTLLKRTGFIPTGLELTYRLSNP